jgi:hypothetical protein
MVRVNLQGNESLGNILKKVRTNWIYNGKPSVEETKGFAYGMASHPRNEIKETVMREIKNYNMDFVRGVDYALFRKKIKGSPLETMLAVADKNPKNYTVYDTRREGSVNVERRIEDKAGNVTVRAQSFEPKSGKLLLTGRRINDDYSIYTDPKDGTLSLEYFTEVPDKDGYYDLNSVYVKTAPKTYSDVKAFFESQKNNMH